MIVSRAHPFAIAMLCLAGLIGMPGCARKPDDVQIVKSIQSRIHTDPEIQGDVNVESKLGLVTLSGHVSSEEERALIAREAKSIAGVVGVLNDLTVEASKKSVSRRASRNKQSQSRTAEESPRAIDKPFARGAAAPPPVIAESAPPANLASAVTPAPAVAPASPPASIPVARLRPRLQSSMSLRRVHQFLSG